MARIARIVIPGIPHLVTQRGNRREQVFFEDGDYQLYTDFILEAAAKANCEVWGFCWMPNHTHTILVPKDEDGLRKTFADAHRRYTAHINNRLKVTGHLWQGRFGSVALDEDHIKHALHYVSLNPVRAKLVKKPQQWKWSSVSHHLNNENDRAFKATPALKRIGNFKSFIATKVKDETYKLLRSGETVGRPAGDLEWLKKLEKKTGRKIIPNKRGPKPKAKKPIAIAKPVKKTILPTPKAMEQFSFDL